MSNEGRIIPSQKETYVDKVSGRKITKLTNSGRNYHYYFTENSFTEDGKEIIYGHSESSPYAEGGMTDVANYYAMNIETGESVQLTDFEAHFGKGCNTSGGTKSKDGEYIIFFHNTDLYAFVRSSGEYRLLYRTPVGYRASSPNVSFDNRYVVIALNEVPEYDRTFKVSNYDGFLDRFYGQKRGAVAIARMDGKGGWILYEDTHWVGHVQFAPDTNEYISFCHEGPWNYVQQRIWLLNTITREVHPCVRQKQDDSIGHEFWTRDGLIFYDNRGVGHDGTITSDKTQAVTISHDGPDAIPRVGFADKSGKVLRELELPYYCNHYHANNDNTLLVADAVNDIVLMDISTDNASIETLAVHNNGWYGPGGHCHPTWSWDNKYILYASDDGYGPGFMQLYLIEM